MQLQADLPAGATPEETEAFIQATLGDLKADEPRQDTADKSTSSEEPSAGEPSATKTPGGDDQAQKSKPENRDWLDEETKGLVATLGITDEQLAGFSSRDELDRALRLLDQTAMQVARQLADKGKPDQGGQASPQQSGEPKAEPDQSKAEPDRHPQHPDRRPDGTFLPESERKSYQVKLDPAYHDAEIIKEFNSLRDHYEERLEALAKKLSRFEQAEVAQAAQIFEQHFDSLVDSLGQQELFGETGKETPDQMANRRKLLAAHCAHLAGLKALGRSGKTDKAFLERALHMEFVDYLSKQTKTKLTERMRQQAAQKLGSGSVTSKAGRGIGGLDDPEVIANLETEYERIMERWSK